MTLSTSNGAGILAPEQVQALVVQPLLAEAITTQVSSIVQTASSSTRFPIVQTDPTTAWTAESAEISVSDAVIAELDVVPSKLAGLTVVSNELVNDSDPSALSVVGAGLVRDLQSRMDAAFFGTTTANGPSGLESIAATTVWPSGGTADLDWAVTAISQAQQVGAELTAFVAHPTTIEAILKARVGTGYNATLLAADPSSPTNRSVYGVPLYASRAVRQGRVWGIDRSRVFVVLRNDAQVVVDSSAYFSSDRTAVRCVLRAGFGFVHAASVIKIGIGGS
jgi:HK97 family phage major capsid protein